MWRLVADGLVSEALFAGTTEVKPVSWQHLVQHSGKLSCFRGVKRSPFRFTIAVVRESAPDFHTIDQDNQVIDFFSWRRPSYLRRLEAV